jgi:hypothetical protein
MNAQADLGGHLSDQRGLPHLARTCQDVDEAPWLEEALTQRGERGAPKGWKRG